MNTTQSPASSTPVARPAAVPQREVPQPATTQVTDQHIADYNQDGFVKIESMITPEEAAFYYEHALAVAQENAANKKNTGVYSARLNQAVNIWPTHDILRHLTFHPAISAAATALSGGPLRLWHDQVLCKDPHNGSKTEWHQDRPYWPHNNSIRPISCWLALCDVPEEKGCMSFMPGQHGRTI